MFIRSLNLMITFAALTCVVSAQNAVKRFWNQDVVYFVLIDRFFDGDPSNNVPEDCSPALYDAEQRDVAKYHGGDLRGLEIAIKRGYFKELGITALCLTPPTRHVWKLEDGSAGYLGDALKDLRDIDPHWTSARSFDGKTDYPATQEGRMQHYKDFVALAHSHDLKVLQSVACHRVEATASDFETAGQEAVAACAFYVNEAGVDGLRMVAIDDFPHAFWDAFTERLRNQVGSPRNTELLIVGDVRKESATKGGELTYRSDYPNRREPCFDSVSNLVFASAIREYLRPTVGPFGSAKALETAWRSLIGLGGGRPKFNPKPGLDKLTAGDKQWLSIEDHTEINRFLVPPVEPKQNILANGLLLLAEGIPCLYYGTETSLPDANGKVGKPGFTGRLTLIPRGKAENFDAIRNTQSYQTFAGLIALRSKSDALINGKTSFIWSDTGSDSADDGVFAYIRYTRTKGTAEPADFALVVINASGRTRATSAQTTRMKLVSQSGRPLLFTGQKLVRLPVQGLDPANTREQTIPVAWEGKIPKVELLLAPQTVNVYRVNHKLGE
jgi:glycosidase